MSTESTSVIFSGTFERSLDVKKRVTVPSRWLSGVEQEFHCVPDAAKHYLLILPPQEFARVEDRLIEQGLALRERQKFLRGFYGSSHVVATDKQGRMLLPEPLCQVAGLSESVLLIGTGRRFEVWNPARWAAENPADTEDYLRIAGDVGL